MIQNLDELEEWYEKEDPWQYENNEYDQYRKAKLLNSLEKYNFKNILDIGCGNGFITKDLSAEYVCGVDISQNAIKHAKKYEHKDLDFMQKSLFELSNCFSKKFDLIIITGVLYPQYIGNSYNLVYDIIDGLLSDNGILLCVHIEEWYSASFPYLCYKKEKYSYREYTHLMEFYIK